MNIKRTQGLQPADAGKYKHLKKKIAALKNSLRQEELKASNKSNVPAAKETVKVSKKEVSRPSTKQ